jgi:hypothetical protein
MTHVPSPPGELVASVTASLWRGAVGSELLAQITPAQLHAFDLLLRLAFKRGFRCCAVAMYDDPTELDANA